MKLKPGVRLHGVRPEVVAAMFVAQDVYKRVAFKLGIPDSEFVLTSVADGIHAVKESLHYGGCAFDVRIHDFPDNISKASLRAELEVALGPDFDVLQENLGEPEEHLHVEYQPKTA